MTPEQRQRHFQRLHAEGRDFWNDPASAYERGKRRAILNALARSLYASVLEVGCSTGLLSRHVARRAERFLAVDVSDTAIRKTRGLLIGQPHACARVASVPGRWPRRSFDLILLSEMLYYLDPAELARLAAHCARTLRPGGEIVIVCYLGETETPLNGAASAAAFIDAILDLRPLEIRTHATAKPYLHVSLQAVGANAVPSVPKGRGACRHPYAGRAGASGRV